jgi:hypothetical protein
VQLTFVAGAGTLYSDPTCAMALPGEALTLPAGAASAPVYVSLSTAGAFELSAASPNYLPGSVVGVTLSPDAGVPPGTTVLNVACDCGTAPGTSLFLAALAAACLVRARRT